MADCSLFITLLSVLLVEPSPRGGDRTVAVPTSEAKSAALGTGNKEEIARHHIASELLQTEKNFVKILNTIVTVSWA